VIEAVNNRKQVREKRHVSKRILFRRSAWAASVLGNFELESGITLPDARLAYKTHGTLNEAKDNAILFPHMWSGTPKTMEIFIGEDRPLDLRKYFVILPGQFANGFSSSPSNTPLPFNGGAFPNVTIGDDVRAQHRLLTERYGIQRLELVLGWSMGAEQTYEWAVRYPDMVKRALPFAGTAKTTPHNYFFVRSHEGCHQVRPGLEQRLLQRPACCVRWFAPARADLVSDGTLPTVLQQGGLARGRLHVPGGFPASVLGSVLPADGPQQSDLDGLEMAAWRREPTHERRSGGGTRPNQSEDPGRTILL
jgi:pimeloyl-ACP methyl ester carboxylesterase